MLNAPVQTGASLGRQLVFFLFLLVPGYLAVQAYYWANVALENDARVNRLVLMAIGGFASLAVVALWRQLVPTVRVAQLAFLTPEWLVVDGVLRVRTISRLSILESVNLIVSQAVVAVLGGYTCGKTQSRLSGRRRADAPARPWKRLLDALSEGDRIQVLTADGDRLVGTVTGFTRRAGDDGILLANARWTECVIESHQSRDGGLTRISRENVTRLSVRRTDSDE